VLDPVPVAGVETALLEGRPAEVLTRVAEQRDASEIVVGSPKPGRVRAVVGSRVVHRLIATAGRPVVVVPAARAR
jgi:nucleotide-binding universal stress UspA family protein